MHIRIFSSNPMSRVRLIGRAMTEDFHRKFSRNRHRLSSRIPWSCTSWSEMGDKRREREKRGGSEMHVSPLHTRSALVTCIILRWFMRPRYVSARVFILSLSLSLLADPSSLSLSVALAPCCTRWERGVCTFHGWRRDACRRERDTARWEGEKRGCGGNVGSQRGAEGRGPC